MEMFLFLHQSKMKPTLFYCRRIAQDIHLRRLPIKKRARKAVLTRLIHGFKSLCMPMAINRTMIKRFKTACFLRVVDFCKAIFSHIKGLILKDLKVLRQFLRSRDLIS